jgi:hypothetical protein
MAEGAQPTRRFDGTGHDPDVDAERAPGAGDEFAPPRPEELAGSSPLDLLKQVISGEVEHEPLTLPVPKRRGVAITYNTELDNDLLTAWRKRSMYDDSRDGVDPLKFACIVLTNKAVGFTIHGRPVTADGHPLTFASSEVWEMVKPPAMSGIDAVRRLYGVDAHVIIAGEEVLRAAGYGDQIHQVEADPTVEPLRR